MLQFAVTGAYCSAHPGASNCSPNNPVAEIFAILIVAAIVGLVLFNLWWKMSRGGGQGSGPVTRLLGGLVGGASRRSGPRIRD